MLESMFNQCIVNIFTFFGYLSGLMTGWALSSCTPWEMHSQLMKDIGLEQFKRTEIVTCLDPPLGPCAWTPHFPQACWPSVPP